MRVGLLEGRLPDSANAQSSGCPSWAAVSSGLGMDLVDMYICLHMCVLGVGVYIYIFICMYAGAYVCAGMYVC